MRFYGEQLSQHLSQIIAIPSDPRDLAVKEIKVLKDLKFKHEFSELLKLMNFYSNIDYRTHDMSLILHPNQSIISSTTGTEHIGRVFAVFGAYHKDFSYLCQLIRKLAF